LLQEILPTATHADHANADAVVRAEDTRRVRCKERTAGY
jgi:hypothetical protein